MGLPERTARRRLHELHDEHGGLLLRSEGNGGRTKLYVDAERLLELDETTRRRASDGDGRVAQLERRVAELEDFRRKALTWFQEHNAAKTRPSGPRL